MNYNVTLIPANKLFHHPNNPRTEYGDLSDLGQSLLTMGFLQNLMVVPYDPAAHGEIPGADVRDCYVVVAGNRRLEASWQVGVEELPCSIRDLDLPSQIGSMYTENNIREEANPYKEAQNFQMLLDMGESMDAIGKRCGFSASTVRNRLKLLDLDPKKFQKAQERGVTISDYLQLNKLEDLELKNKVLDKLGTKDFANEMEKALSTEKKRRYCADMLATIQTFATMVEKSEDIPVKNEYHVRYGGYNMTPVKVPEDIDSVRYFAKLWPDGDVTLYHEVIETDEDRARKAAEEERRQQKQREAQERKELKERLFTLRRNFISEVSASHAKKLRGEIVAVMVDNQITRTHNQGYWYENNYKLNLATFASVLDIPYNQEEKEVDKDALEQCIQASPEFVLLAATYSMWDSVDQAYFTTTWSSEKMKDLVSFKANDDLNKIYDFLTSFGYKLSDEELMLQNGDHPIFAEYNAEMEEKLAKEAAAQKTDTVQDESESPSNSADEAAA